MRCGPLASHSGSSVIEAVSEGERLSAAAVAARTGIDFRSTERVLRQLFEDGYIGRLEEPYLRPTGRALRASASWGELRMLHRDPITHDPRRYDDPDAIWDIGDFAGPNDNGVETLAGPSITALGQEGGRPGETAGATEEEGRRVPSRSQDVGETIDAAEEIRYAGHTYLVRNASRRSEAITSLEEARESLRHIEG